MKDERILEWAAKLRKLARVPSTYADGEFEAMICNIVEEENMSTFGHPCSPRGELVSVGEIPTLEERFDYYKRRCQALESALLHLRNHTSVSSHQIELIDQVLWKQ